MKRVRVRPSLTNVWTYFESLYKNLTSQWNFSKNFAYMSCLSLTHCLVCGWSSVLCVCVSCVRKRAFNFLKHKHDDVIFTLDKYNLIVTIFLLSLLCIVCVVYRSSCTTTTNSVVVTKYLNIYSRHIFFFVVFAHTVVQGLVKHKFPLRSPK